MAFVSVLSVGSAVYFYNVASENKQTTAKQSQKEVDSLLTTVSKLIVLPEGEKPTIATVTDPEKLKNQAFFAHAKKGDKVLIFPIAKKAILFDPVNNKILEVAPINIGTTPPTK